MNIPELIKRVRASNSNGLMCDEAADALESLQADIEFLNSAANEFANENESLLEKQDNDDMIIDAANKRIEELEDRVERCGITGRCRIPPEPPE